MKTKLPHKIRKARIATGPLASDDSCGNNGAFELEGFLIIVSDGEGWDHVSVSIPGADRCPTWEEMCKVKEWFFERTERVVQFHAPESEHINNHSKCLHLWRCQFQVWQSPPGWMVGDKSLGTLI